MAKSTPYESFLSEKLHNNTGDGFAPSKLPTFLYDFQAALVDWSIRRGRSAIFADCGLGKTPMQLVWADEIVRHTNKPVLIATPLAVSHQVVAEANKFGIECRRVTAQRELSGTGIYVTNYERLHLFDSGAFAGMVCDESSILKNFDGKRKYIVTNFMRRMQYRLLCTATAAPNDYIELGTSSEAIGEMGHMDMLGRFFKNDQNTTIDTKRKWMRSGGSAPKWRFKKHAETPFWRWVCSWARAVRAPSDLGFDNDGFILPALVESEHIVKARIKREGMLFDLPSVGLWEQREERRRTINERCEKVAEIAGGSEQVLVWCHLNAEGDLLERLIPGSLQVAGAHSDELKEDRLSAFARGDLRVLVTKPKIGAWGLNLQRCAHVTFFPSHSYEQYYQGVRRCWRFGQTRPVQVDIVSTEGGHNVMENLKRKAHAADRMFTELVSHMNDAERIRTTQTFSENTEVPLWL